MVQIPHVPITRPKKEMDYEKCVNLLLQIMEIFEKN